MFEGFATEMLDVGDATLHVRHGGHGPAVLLLHGHPRTGATWHKVAPLLVAAGFTVVSPDPRGYGASIGPEPAGDHRPHSKRVVANEMAQLMTRLGHDRFHLVGHDRGSYVALRLALGHEGRVDRLALLDCIPISEHLARADARFATLWWHWFFFAQSDIPERVINADPDAWYGGDPDTMGAENYAEFLRAIHDPRVVRAMLEDYRAGLTLDRADEEADKATGRMLSMPLLALWSIRISIGPRFHRYKKRSTRDKVPRRPLARMTWLGWPRDEVPLFPELAATVRASCRRPNSARGSLQLLSGGRRKRHGNGRRDEPPC